MELDQAVAGGALHPLVTELTVVRSRSILQLRLELNGAPKTRATVQGYWERYLALLCVGDWGCTTMGLDFVVLLK